MLALAGYPLGLRFRFLDSSPEAPAGQVAPLLVGALDDPEVLQRFATGLDLITYEFENIPAPAVRFLAGQVPLFPPPEALGVSQDRFAEKSFFRRLEIPTPDFVPVSSRADLEAAVKHVGLPAVLKTCRMGYDGKGQMVLRDPHAVEHAWHRIGPGQYILEAFVPFDREVSLLAVRNTGKETAYWPLVENHHHEGILRLSLAPAPHATAHLQAEAERFANRVLEALDYVGVLAIEFFEVSGRLLANEMAPRVHNSGHWTIEGALTSQFANHWRAGLGLPLGLTTATGPSAMLNIIGVLPRMADVLAVPGAHLHLYGKSVQPGRKLGHVTVLAPDWPTLQERIGPLKPAFLPIPGPYCE
jgi:5-(carboxyamino)imidazole ribonucleotide synthase